MGGEPGTLSILEVLGETAPGLRQYDAKTMMTYQEHNKNRPELQAIEDHSPRFLRSQGCGGEWSGKPLQVRHSSAVDFYLFFLFTKNI